MKQITANIVFPHLIVHGINIRKYAIKLSKEQILYSSHLLNSFLLFFSVFFFFSACHTPFSIPGTQGTVNSHCQTPMRLLYTYYP